MARTDETVSDAPYAVRMRPRGPGPTARNSRSKSSLMRSTSVGYFPFRGGDLISEAWSVAIAIRAFCRDTADANGFANELEQSPIGIAYGDDDSASLSAMHCGKRDGAFAIHETGDIGGHVRSKAASSAIPSHPP